MVLAQKGWIIYEVKKASSAKPEHYVDAAVQWWVLTNCGLEMDDVFITHINTSCMKNGDLDIQQYFESVSIKDQVQKMESRLQSYISDLNVLVKQPSEPEIDIGIHCSKPHSCMYHGYCWRHIPENSIFDIAGYKLEKKFKLYYDGVIRLEDIPGEYPLSRGYKIQVDAYNKNLDHIENEEISNSLMDLAYPLYYLDFEGLYNLAIPVFDNSRPYQQIPFQYSLHVQHEKGGEVNHYEFLANTDSEPRIPFIENLLSNLGSSGSIIVFNKNYEATRLKEIARDFPQYADSIQPILTRIWDLMKIFQSKYYYTPTMKGSYSIKDVLPALVPDLSYKHLEIQDGGTASDQFLVMVQNVNSDKSYTEIKNNLLKYCELDTFAMVKLLEKLQAISSS